jgi:hypothetical protein
MDNGQGERFTRQLPCQHCAGRWILTDTQGAETVQIAHQGEPHLSTMTIDRWQWQQEYGGNLGRVARRWAQWAHPLLNLKKPSRKLVRRG